VPDDHGERLARLEANQDNLTKSVEKIDSNVEEIRALANQSKGAFYTLMGLSGVIGGAIVWLLDRIPILKNLH